MLFQFHDYITFDDMSEFVAAHPEFIRFFAFFILIFAAIAFTFVFGFVFIGKGISEKQNLAQKAYQKGLGFFLVSGGIVMSTNVFDVVYGFLYGERFFQNFWEDYQFDTIMLYDYFIIMWVSLLLAGTFLVYPIEKYMLKRTPRLAIIAAAFSPLPILVRLLEYRLGDAIKAGNVLHLAFTIIWIFINVLVIIILAFGPALYVKMAKVAPKGSKLRKKCVEIIFGYALIIIGNVTTNRAFNFIYESAPLGTSNIILPEWFYVVIVPILYFVALYLMTSGFRRDFETI